MVTSWYCGWGGMAGWELQMYFQIKIWFSFSKYMYFFQHIKKSHTFRDFCCLAKTYHTSMTMSSNVDVVISTEEAVLTRWRKSLQVRMFLYVLIDSLTHSNTLLRTYETSYHLMAETAIHLEIVRKLPQMVPVKRIIIHKVLTCFNCF